MLSEKGRNNFFGKGTEISRGKEWDWENFQTTKDFPVSNNLLDWVVGQERVLEEVKLALDEWLYKLKWLQNRKWYKPWLEPQNEKTSFSRVLTPGPYILLLGDPGTGKSLIGRAMAEHLTMLYKKHRIKRFDILCWPNELLPSNPKISIHPAGKGTEIVIAKTKAQVKKSFLSKWSTRILLAILGGFGALLLGFGFLNTLIMLPVVGIFNAVLSNALLISMGGSLIFFCFFIWNISRFFVGQSGSNFGMVAGARRSNAPKLLVDNSSKNVPFVDATGHQSAQLFGCFDEETRLMTLDGLKKYNDLKEGELVLSLDPKTEGIVSQPIQKIFIYSYDGEMIEHSSKKGLNFKVTPNHRMLYRPRKKYDKIEREIDIKELSKIKGSRWYIPTKGKIWKGLDQDFSKDELELLGWFLSEGSLIHTKQRVVISQTHYKKEISNLLKRMKLRFHYQSNGDFIIREPFLYRKFLKYGHSNSKFIPRKVLDLPRKKLLSLFRILMLGDGNSRMTTYYTTSKNLRDNFIELAIKLGYAVSFSEDNRNTSKSKKCYRINLSRKEGYISSSKLERVPYRGKIWCVTVPNHSILVERKGKLFFSSQSIAWDPYQTGGLGTPEHQRVLAGDVHRASMGILYIDEIKNLSPLDAITLLSVMEDGSLPITLRSHWHGGDTAAMAVSTEPIPTLFFLLAAGNFDAINQIHPALMDRLVGYGRVVRMNNDMPNKVENRRKYVQFIAQEIERFHLLPFSREACIELIEEGRRRSGKRDALTTKFRPLISVIKTASTLARNEGKETVDISHVKTALDVHCKTIQKQLLEHQIQEQGKLLEIKPEGNKLGTLYGLAVVSDPVSGEMTGSVLRIKGQLCKKKKTQKNLSGYYRVTGIAKDAKWMHDSIEKVRSVLIRKYGVDIAQEYFTHLDFSQAYGVDGPSAGVTMALLICSLLEGKPIRQDVAVTGEINISSEDEIEITAVGGVHEKIRAAEAWGFKKVVIPIKNYKYSIKESDYKLEVIGARTLDDYLKEVLVECGDKTGSN